MKTITITFNEWGSGFLVRPDDLDNGGAMCCLGFGCSLLGAPISKMEGKGMPTTIRMGAAFRREFGLNKKRQYEAATLNDSFHTLWGAYWETDVPEYKRTRLEKARMTLFKLRKLFRDHGTQLRIVGLPDELR